MNAAGTPLRLARCDACRGRFLPNDGPCPRCGGRSISLYEAPPVGQVLAATSLETPAEGWTPAHRLALIEVADGVRLLATVEGPLPGVETQVSVRWEAPIYVARALPAASR